MTTCVAVRGFSHVAKNMIIDMVGNVFDLLHEELNDELLIFTANLERMERIIAFVALETREDGIMLVPLELGPLTPPVLRRG